MLFRHKIAQNCQGKTMEKKSEKEYTYIFMWSYKY